MTISISRQSLLEDATYFKNPSNTPKLNLPDGRYSGIIRGYLLKVFHRRGTAITKMNIGYKSANPIAADCLVKNGLVVDLIPKGPA